MASPANGSTFTSTSVTFNWNAGSGVSQYYLYVGSSFQSAEIFNNYIFNGTQTVTGIPGDGRTIYVTLWSLINGGWQANNYTFKASNNGGGVVKAQISGPEDSSACTTTRVPFH